MDNSQSESISFSIHETNLEAFIQTFFLPKTEKNTLEISITDYDLDNNIHLKKVYNKRRESYSKLNRRKKNSINSLKKKLDHNTNQDYINDDKSIPRLLDNKNIINKEKPTENIHTKIHKESNKEYVKQIDNTDEINNSTIQSINNLNKKEEKLCNQQFNNELDPTNIEKEILNNDKNTFYNINQVNNNIITPKNDNPFFEINNKNENNIKISNKNEKELEDIPQIMVNKIEQSEITNDIMIPKKNITEQNCVRLISRTHNNVLQEILKQNLNTAKGIILVNTKNDKKNFVKILENNKIDNENIKNYIQIILDNIIKNVFEIEGKKRDKISLKELDIIKAPKQQSSHISVGKDSRIENKKKLNSILYEKNKEKDRNLLIIENLKIDLTPSHSKSLEKKNSSDKESIDNNKTSIHKINDLNLHNINKNINSNQRIELNEFEFSKVSNIKYNNFSKENLSKLSKYDNCEFSHISFEKKEKIDGLEEKENKDILYSNIIISQKDNCVYPKSQNEIIGNNLDITLSDCKRQNTLTHTNLDENEKNKTPHNQKNFKVHISNLLNKSTSFHKVKKISILDLLDENLKFESLDRSVFTINHNKNPIVLKNEMILNEIENNDLIKSKKDIQSHTTFTVNENKDNSDINLYEQFKGEVFNKDSDISKNKDLFEEYHSIHNKNNLKLLKTDINYYSENRENNHIIYLERSNQEDLNYSNNLDDVVREFEKKKEESLFINRIEIFSKRKIKHVNSLSDSNAFIQIENDIPINDVHENDENIYSIPLLENKEDYENNSYNLSIRELFEIHDFNIEEFKEVSDKKINIPEYVQILENVSENRSMHLKNISRTYSEKLGQSYNLNETNINYLRDMDNSYNNLSIINISKKNKIFSDNDECSLDKKCLNVDDNSKNTEIQSNENQVNSINLSTFSKKQSLKFQKFFFTLGDNSKFEKEASKVSKNLKPQNSMKVVIENKINIELSKEKDKAKTETNREKPVNNVVERQKPATAFKKTNTLGKDLKYKIKIVNDKNTIFNSRGFYTSRNKNYDFIPKTRYYTPINFYNSTYWNISKKNRISTSKFPSKKPNLYLNNFELNSKSNFNDLKDLKSTYFFEVDRTSYNSENKYSSKNEVKFNSLNDYKKDNFKIQLDNYNNTDPDISQQKILQEAFSLNIKSKFRDKQYTPENYILKTYSNTNRSPVSNLEEYRNSNKNSSKLFKDILEDKYSISNKFGINFLTKEKPTVIKGNLRLIVDNNINFFFKATKNKLISNTKQNETFRNYIGRINSSDKNKNLKKIKETQFPYIFGLKN